MYRKQRLHERHDALSEACGELRLAVEALEACRSGEHAEAIAALEDIGGELARDRDAIHARIERMDELERRALNMECEQSRR